MVSVLKDGWKKLKITNEIPIEWIQSLILNPSEKDLILKLQTISKKDNLAAYDHIKKKLTCIKPHGTFKLIFKGVNKKGKPVHEYKFIRSSGIIFFDIDDCDESYKEFILQKHSDKIYMLGKSVGGKGLFFYIKISEPKLISETNFLQIQRYFKDEVFSDIKIDNNSLGIARNHVLPYDPNLYINTTVTPLSIPKKIFETDSGIIRGIKEQREERGEQYTTDDTRNKIPFEIIDIRKLIINLVIQTPVDIGEKEFIHKPIPFIKLQYKQYIKQGRRHRTYRKMINAIVYNNPGWSFDEVFSYVHYINFRQCSEPLTEKDLFTTVKTHFDKVKVEGVKGLKIKSIHTNPDKQFCMNRRKVARRETSKLQIQSSIEILQSAIDILVHENKKITQQSVLELIESRTTKTNKGIKMGSIKRHWHKAVFKRNGE